MPSRSTLVLSQAAPDPATGPSAPWLAAGLLLAGLGTVLLGPILPVLSTAWHLSDRDGGLLLAAKFVGAFLGGVSIPRQLRRGILSGTLLCALGFGAFALSTGLLSGAATLFLAGLGLGQIIASTNILAGHRYRAHTGSALALLNFFWSLGAVATGLLVAALLPRFGLPHPLYIFAAAFALTGVAGLFNPAISTPEHRNNPAAPVIALPCPAFLYFATLLFLYGGLETALTGWLTTYSLRFSTAQPLAGQSAVVLLWAALTAGRILAAALMRRFSETSVRAAGLLVSIAMLLGLLAVTDSLAQSLFCLGLGLGLAPFFPATFGLLLRRDPGARTAGFILAVSGLGAALFPWLVGEVSTRTGSLREAMLLPVALALALLLLGFAEPLSKSVSDTFSTSPQSEHPEKMGV